MENPETAPGPGHAESTSQARRRGLVIGVGNVYGHDDAVGRLVARRIGQVEPSIRVAEQSGEATGLMECWEDASEIVLIDAVSTGAPVGTLHRINASDEPLDAGMFRTSTHSFGVSEAIELARALGQLPTRVTLIGIEGVDFSPGEGLTPQVAQSIDDAAALVLDVLSDS